MKKSFIKINSILKVFFICIFCAFLFSCVKVPEMTLKEIEEAKEKESGDLILLTKSKPYKSQEFVPGKEGGVWNESILGDPKTFNQLIAERDNASSSIVALTTDYLFDYDYNTRTWKPQACFFEVEADEEKDTITVHCTLRDNLFWTYYNSSEKIPVTSDDIVWWYNEISGDERFQSSAYGGQFLTMEDGSVRRIKAIKIDDKRFDIVFPSIISDPLLFSNCNFAPCFIYKKAKEKGGVEGVKNLFGINTDPKLLPSMGRWYIIEYVPGQRIVLEKNDNYWKKDSEGNTAVYPKRQVLQIVGDMNTNYLLFKQGKLETCSSTPENLEDFISSQEDSYTVFNAEASGGAEFWSFNQNPKNQKEPFYEWFTKKEFRQAMSCLLNRERIVDQSYRGLASAKLDFFPKANPFYNPQIKNEYTFNPERALSLLEKIGITRNNSTEPLVDKKANKIEFDLMIVATNPIASDVAQIIADEAAKVGIKINVRQTDFQKLVEMLTSTYDWQSLIISLGSNLFPVQGSNVWPSNGNLHLWYPLQKKPATTWEARIDYLYHLGSRTLDTEKAFTIWDEYQRIILEQCPIVYLFSSKSFYGIQNRWDLTNFYFDNIYGALTDYVFLKQ